jgi:endonuclease YncB( thermonuclease family)
MAVLAFVLLIAALVLFFVSTNQWKLWMRGAVWAGGVVLLAIAGFLVASDQRRGGGLFQAVGDLAAHWYAPGNSILAQSLSHNGPSVGRFVLPLLDLYLILGLILGVVAIIAFSPGEKLERALRPLMVGLVGAILGGVLALGIVGTGFGEVAQQRAYITYVDREDVADGDTLWIGQASVRLRGIDAPELGQVCRTGSQRQDCGAAARRHLQDILTGALVTCLAENTDARSGGTFRRPLVTCSASRRGEPTFDIGQRMVGDGYAIERRGLAGYYEEDARLAKEENLGLLPSCTLRPDVWIRLDGADRDRFRDTGLYPEDAPTMGYCPPPPRRGSRQGPAPTYTAPE